MKFSVIIWLLGFILIGLSSAYKNSETKIVKHTDAEDPQKEGFWTRNVSWKSRWVKYWRQKAIYVPIWKKVWSPVVQNEWVPLPNAPPGWSKSAGEHKIREVKY